jgi:uncharacterized SAM-binding protein YcdF (DUF218 family)
MRRKQHGGIIFRLLSLLAFLLLFAAIYAIRYPLLRTVGRAWIVSEPFEHANAILVIGDDNFSGDRAARAAELYRAGQAPTVVASGRRLRTYAGIAELIDRDLENHGVPSTFVVRFAHDASSTIEEARALNHLVAERHWRRLILVTSNYHARRARYIFRKILPSDISLEVVGAPDSDFDPDSWWQTHRGEELFLHEIFGYGYAMWELRGS